jgi:SAM-dependent methyltransferase
MRKDEYIREHFQVAGEGISDNSLKEQSRIKLTLGIIPCNWDSILDVGCGDGRVSRGLVMSGKFVVGIDWSNSSVKKFAGHAVVCDIREDWPIKKCFDGAICTEVVEHLCAKDVARILTNMRRFARKGFVVTVPANEKLQILTTRCLKCKKDFHLYGHVNSFSNFDDVDTLIGQKSKQRLFIKSQTFSLFRLGSYKSKGYIPSVFIDRLRRLVNYYPYIDNSICPHCGMRLPEPSKLNSWKKAYLRLLKFIELVTSDFRRERGWFCCLYENSASSFSTDMTTHYPNAYS